MLDRRKMPEPPVPVTSEQGDLFWVDEQGKVWRYVPLRQQLEELRAGCLEQARQFAGVCITAASLIFVVAAVGVAVLLNPSNIGITAVLLICAVTLAVIAVARHFGRDPVMWEQELRAELQEQGLTPLLLDSELAHLQQLRLNQLYPSLFGAIDRPDRIAAQIRHVALQLPALLRVNGHAERLNHLVASPGVLAQRTGWIMLNGMPAASTLIILSSLFYGVGLPWALAAVLCGPALLRCRVAEMALISELLDER